MGDIRYGKVKSTVSQYLGLHPGFNQVKVPVLYLTLLEHQVEKKYSGIIILSKTILMIIDDRYQFTFPYSVPYSSLPTYSLSIISLFPLTSS